jgi:hypothetical protein
LPALAFAIRAGSIPPGWAGLWPLQIVEIVVAIASAVVVLQPLLMKFLQMY